jgi:hypothetical protein
MMVLGFPQFGQTKISLPKTRFNNEAQADRNPQQPALYIDILDVQGAQRAGAQTQGAQQQNDGQIAQPGKIPGLFTEMAHQGLVLFLGQKVWDGFFDFRIGQMQRDVFANMSIESQEMVELAQNPDARFARVHRRLFKVGGKINKLQIPDML